ncbi:MAG: CocE/NonD family hydrolase, partial [Bryobacteraceae bacterium]
LNFGGWFDTFRQGTLRGYTGMHTRGGSALAREGANLVIGPWGHWPGRKVGGLDFGDTAFVDQNALALRWFDHWLKGLDNGIGREPAVKLFVMGANEWRFEKEYPLARTSYRKLYLANGSGLSWNPPAGEAPPDRYIYDPDKLTNGPSILYNSAVLTEPLEVTGPVKAVLFASSDAVDTDFVAKLLDVYPDGKAYRMASGILRARYRNSVSRPEFLQPGKIYELQVDLIGTSNVFGKGHRIRLEVSSSDYPAFDRHLNTGDPFGTGVKAQIAHQAVFHSATSASYILLPVIPALDSTKKTAYTSVN